MQQGNFCLPWDVEKNTSPLRRDDVLIAEKGLILTASSLVFHLLTQQVQLRCGSVFSSSCALWTVSRDFSLRRSWDGQLAQSLPIGTQNNYADNRVAFRCGLLDPPTPSPVPPHTNTWNICTTHPLPLPRQCLLGNDSTFNKLQFKATPSVHVGARP